MTELSLDQALKLAAAVLAEGRRIECSPLTVAVLDPGGHLRAFCREDGSGILRPEIATGKAYGALGMGVGSRTLARLAEPLSASRIGIWQDTLTSKDLAEAEQFVADRGLTDVYQQCFAEAGS